MVLSFSKVMCSIGVVGQIFYHDVSELIRLHSDANAGRQALELASCLQVIDDTQDVSGALCIAPRGVLAHSVQVIASEEVVGPDDWS
jgi:hypothetical protein